MAINNQPTIEPRTVTGIFTKYIAKTLPLAFDESMSYYECLCALLEYLNETIVPDINNTNEGLSELQTFYLQLQSYVNGYFDNLDVQEEINNKLDEMVQNGELQTLLNEQYNDLRNEINNELESFQVQINRLESGSPLVANSISEMTDTNRIYVLTTDGNWYYYNGTNWVSGGVYQASKIADKSIDILMLDDKVSSNFNLRFSNDINKGNDLQGYAYGSLGETIQIETDTQNYFYNIINLDVNNIYVFSGNEPTGRPSGLIVVNSSNKIILSTNVLQTKSIIFRCNESGMKAYLSRYNYTIGTNPTILYFPSSLRLRKLENISNNLKIDTNIPLLNTINDYGFQSQTLNSTLSLNSYNGNKLFTYPMEKGKKYNIKAYHNYLFKAYVITDLNYNVLEYENTILSGTSNVTYEYLANVDGYIFIQTPDEELHPVSIEIIIDTIEIPDNQYQNIKSKNIVYDGDSICESRLVGNQSNGGAFAKIISDITNSTYTNQAVGGAHLAHWTTTERHCVVDNLSNLPANADLYVFCAGINDFWGKAQIGVTTSDYTSEVDDTTIKGAMEKIFRYCLNNYPSSKILFVIEHKIQNTSFTPNTNGDTFKDYHDAMIEICNKYSVPYYDAFNESNLNGWNSNQSNLYLNSNSSGTPDGTHPNELGYKKFYVPQLLEIYKTLFKI